MEKTKTWDEAQSYCREAFDDLATVGDQEENDKLLKVLQGRGNYAWIGFFDDMTRWTWAEGDAEFNNDTDYSDWKTDEPDNKNSNEKCVVMTKSGTWRDYPCWLHNSAVCYDGKGFFFPN